MSLQYSTTLRNNQLSEIETTIGTAPHMIIYTGSAPANCAATATGTTLADITLPSDWMNAPSSGSVTKNGTWTGTASGTGTAGYYRVYDSGITTCGIQGTVTATGGGGDMTLDNTSIASGQQVTISTYTISAGNS